MIFAALLLAFAQPHPIGEIGERLRDQPSFTLTSRKQPADLEFCVADVLSRVATPAAFRDGPNRTIVIATLTGFSQKIVATVELNGAPQGTTIVGRIMGKGWDDRIHQRVAACG